MTNRIVQTITAPFQPAQPIPIQYRNNFIHLFFDTAWFGVLNGSIIAFINIYAARLGASGEQIGLIGAAPAIVNLFLVLPAGKWMERKPTRLAVFGSAVCMRVFYALLIPLPQMLSLKNQVWAIILITFLMSIPGVVIAVGFNALLAEAVPPNWRGYVVGIRNAFLAITTIFFTLLCGQILQRVVFPVGYQVVFAIGTLGAGMSCLHLWFIRPQLPEPYPMVPLNQIAKNNSEIQLRRVHILRRIALPNFRLDILSGSYRKVILLLFLFHLSQYLPIPVFSYYTVNILHFSDQVLSLGNAMFYVLVFLGSLRLESISNRIGNKKTTAIGVMILSLYPLLLTFSYKFGVYMITSIIGGTAWALVGGAIYNYLLEKVPAGDRPAHLAWYNLLFNAAILIGSIVGPSIASSIGPANALLIFALLRFLAGTAIFRWG
jgi:MFS family permease